VNFELLGPYVGKLVVEYWVEFLDHRGIWSTHIVKPYMFLKDEVKLISGKGEVTIVDEQQVYEEGSTITFRVETDYMKDGSFVYSILLVMKKKGSKSQIISVVKFLLKYLLIHIFLMVTIGGR
jgi:CTP:phosphocholine cytidylyltransferase-like protein